METKRLSQAQRQEECNNASDLGTRFYRLEILIGKAPGSADDVRRFKKTTFSVNSKQTLSPRRVPRCQCIRSVQPHVPPVVGVTPVRARGRSWMYIASSRIRASDRKRRSSPRSRSSQNASSTLEDSRQRANPKSRRVIPPEFQRAGLHARLGAATLEWRKPTGRPASKWAFLEAGCHVVSVVGRLACKIASARALSST